MGLICTPYGYSGAAKVSGLSSYQGVILGDKPVAYYPLNVANPLVDLVGGNNLTAISRYSTSATNLFTGSGGSGGSMVLNGALNLQAPYGPTALQEFTLEMWVYDEDTVNTVWLENNENSGWSFQNYSGGEIVWHVGGVNASTPHEVPITLSKPTYLAFSVNSQLTRSFYVNGTLSSSAQATAAPVYSASSYLNLGSRNGAYGGTGKIAAVAVYNTALTAAQIQNHYNAGIA